MMQPAIGLGVRTSAVKIAGSSVTNICSARSLREGGSDGCGMISMGGGALFSLKVVERVAVSLVWLVFWRWASASRLYLEAIFLLWAGNFFKGGFAV